jgi:hypothetical protein
MRRSFIVVALAISGTVVGAQDTRHIVQLAGAVVLAGAGC